MTTELDTPTPNTADYADAAPGAIDENLWLEDIYGEKPLAWAAEQTENTLDTFRSPEFDALTGRLLEVIDSDERIPLVSRHGDFLYNFWRDSAHPRGLWRRTTLESYRTPQPDWDLLLDVDELGRTENTEWVWTTAAAVGRSRSMAACRNASLVGGGPSTWRPSRATRERASGCNRSRLIPVGVIRMTPSSSSALRLPVRPNVKPRRKNDAPSSTISSRILLLRNRPPITPSPPRLGPTVGRRQSSPI